MFSHKYAFWIGIVVTFVFATAHEQTAAAITFASALYFGAQQ